jgi:hypothetical protein
MTQTLAALAFSVSSTSGRRCGFSHVVPEGQGEEGDKNDQSRENLIFVLHRLLLHSRQRFAAQVGFSSFSPGMIRALATSS